MAQNRFGAMPLVSNRINNSALCLFIRHVSSSASAAAADASASSSVPRLAFAAARWEAREYSARKSRYRERNVTRGYWNAAVAKAGESRPSLGGRRSEVGSESTWAMNDS